MSTPFPEIGKRFTLLIKKMTHESRRFKELEELSGIAAVSWRKAFTHGQRPTAEMIEVVSRAWPQHAFWLATGIDDSTRGHNSAEEGFIEEDGWADWERQLRLDELSRKVAGRLFEARIEWNNYAARLWSDSSHLEPDAHMLKLEDKIRKLSYLRDEEEHSISRLEKDGNQES